MGRTHLDVDCDGDLDIIGAPRGDQDEGGEETKPPHDHVYLKNELVARGSKPRFERQPFEHVPRFLGLAVSYRATSRGGRPIFADASRCH